jgi:hypothetical protein
MAVGEVNNGARSFTTLTKPSRRLDTDTDVQEFESMTSRIYPPLQPEESDENLQVSNVNFARGMCVFKIYIITC